VRPCQGKERKGQERRKAEGREEREKEGERKRKKGGREGGRKREQFGQIRFFSSVRSCCSHFFF
jgi:hypothetical protein